MFMISGLCSEFAQASLYQLASFKETFTKTEALHDGSPDGTNTSCSKVLLKHPDEVYFVLNSTATTATGLKEDK